MNLHRCLRQSLATICSSWLRTLLSVLALAVGVATLVVMLGLGQGARRTAMAEIDSLGSNLLTVRAAQERKLTQRQRQFDQVTTLRPDDTVAIAALPEVVAVAPACIRTLRVKHGQLSTTTKVVGTTGEFPAVRGFTVRHGRFFSDAEERAGLRVGIIGSALKQKLFGEGDPLGERLRVGRVPVQIIGVLATKGTSRDGANEDDLLLIPVRTALRRILNIRHLDLVYVQARDAASLGRAEVAVTELLRRRHRLEGSRLEGSRLERSRLERRRLADDFSISNQAALLDAAEATRRSFLMLTLWTAGIALLLGGFGILAIMLLSVRERTTEIGLRLALGARRHDIQLQFLAEALGLASAGGLAGVLLGAVGCVIADSHFGLAAELPLRTAVSAVLFALTTGLIFGVLPARRAARLSPVTALSRQ